MPEAVAGCESEAVDKVAWAVKRTSRLVPGATCLTQALTAQTLLHRRGVSSTLHIGVMKSEQRKLAAHAWVVSHGRVVVGGKKLGCYTPLTTMGPWGEEHADG
jgi:hypothetical protein